MTVTLTEPEWVTDDTVELSWSSDLGGTPTFYLWQWGDLVIITTDTGRQFTIAAGEDLILDVFDSASGEPDAYVSNGRATLCWWPVSGAAQYRVDEYVASVWTERGTVADNGEGFFAWTSRVLEDVTTHEFRIVPLDSAGNTGTATTFSKLMVRIPDVPSVSYAYDSGTAKITVSDA